MVVNLVPSPELNVEDEDEEEGEIAEEGKIIVQYYSSI